MDMNIEMAQRIAQAVQRSGGRTYYVGGCVRDRIIGLENKDIDIEIHGILPEKLEQILDDLGERLSFGKSFGVMGLRHYQLDISMPRLEKDPGRGEKEYAAFVDPFIGAKQAAQRRDFTMNALMQDVLTDEVYDFFGGLKDIQNGCIRHVDDMTFAEDPLRVLRAAQFAARFGFAIADSTAVLASAADIENLPPERVLVELEKALMKSNRPSVFFEELRKMDQLSYWFREVGDLIGVTQSEKYHPEGNVWHHTMLVLDEAAALREQAQEPLWLMLAALCHDFGKATATTTDNNTIHAYGHEETGLPLIGAFLSRLTNEIKLKRYVLNMTELHMMPNQMVRRGSHDKSFMKMYDRSVCPEDLLLLAKADHMGRFSNRKERELLAEDYRAKEQLLRSMLAKYRERMSLPHVTGEDLIDAGAAPSPLMGEALEYAHKLRLVGIPKEKQLQQTLAWIRVAERKTPQKGEADHE